MSGADAARRLGVDRSTVSRMAKAGRIAPIATTLRGRPLFNAETVEAEAARRRARAMFSP